MQADGPVDLTPALIPNVTVNWYTKQTARRESNEPFHVDFVIKTPRVAGDCLAVIEVDGPSHYADFNNGRYQVSEEAYARHLRRDKFLRDSGFKVFRIANIEVMRIMQINDDEKKLAAFYDFFNEAVGDAVFVEKFALRDGAA